MFWPPSTITFRWVRHPAAARGHLSRRDRVLRPQPAGESAWSRLIAPAISGVILAVLAVQHYATLLGVAPGSPAAWALPAAFAVITVTGLVWGLVLRAFRPGVYAAIGMGAYTTTAPAPARGHRGDGCAHGHPATSPAVIRARP
jgi:hypothetical protein